MKVCLKGGTLELAPARDVDDNVGGDAFAHLSPGVQALPGAPERARVARGAAAATGLGHVRASAAAAPTAGEEAAAPPEAPQ